MDNALIDIVSGAMHVIEIGPAAVLDVIIVRRIIRLLRWALGGVPNGPLQRRAIQRDRRRILAQLPLARAEIDSIFAAAHLQMERSHVR